MNYLDHYRDKKVLLTGHTGFKGSWLAIWLRMLGAQVYGYALPASERSLYRDASVVELMKDERLSDIGEDGGLEAFINSIKPDIVFHLAAEAIVGNAHKNPIDAWQTNVMGTLRLISALKKVNDECSVVVITSDKCYENNEWVWGYREKDTLGGKDMYSTSKAAVEILVRGFVNSYLMEEGNRLLLATARAGNVIGGGDWSDYRLVPDCIRSWEKGKTVELRNPRSTRPWQHVLEPLRGYLQLGCSLSIDRSLHGESFNFGPDAANSRDVGELVSELSLSWEGVDWAETCAKTDFGESSLLALNCDKAAARLKWRPILSFTQTISMTSQWYFLHNKGSDAGALCKEQISTYVGMLK